MSRMRVLLMVGVAGLLLPGGWLHAKGRQPALSAPTMLKAVGPAKEVPVGQEVSGCKIEVTAGTVIINTIVVRSGGQKAPITVARKMVQGEVLDLPLGPKRMVDGLRISDSGGGDYRIFFFADPPPGARPPDPPRQH